MFRPGYLTGLARQLRKDMTPAEELLWYKIRRKQLGNIRFRRQHPIGRYIADFCCPDLRLIVELDGDMHLNRKMYDQSRDEYLSACGYRTIRFSNEDVVQRMDEVVEKIRRIAEEVKIMDTPYPSVPFPRSGGKGR